jgi:hypothetical protein
MKHSTFSWGNQVCCSTSAESISKAFKAMALIAFLFLWGGIGLFAQSPSLSITGSNNYSAPANNPGGYAQLPSGYVDCGSVNEGDWTYSAMSNSEFGFGPKTTYFPRKSIWMHQFNLDWRVSWRNASFINGTSKHCSTC